MKWVRDHGGHHTEEVGSTVDAISATGGTPLVVAEHVPGEPARALGVVHLKDVVKEGMRARFDTMRRMGIRTVMITGDNPLTARPGLRHRAQGSLVTGPDGRPVGSLLIGQSFVDAEGQPVLAYFQSRPSAAGDGYDPMASGASNLGPESVEDTADRPSLLTQVCQRSLAVGQLEGVDGRRPYCTVDGVGAVLRVFHADGLTGPVTRVVSVNQPCPATPFVTTYEGVSVECGQPDTDYSGGVLTPIRGDAPSDPAVPADAVTASGSGLDPGISPAYARLQVPRVARERHADPAAIQRLVDRYTTGRTLGFMGSPTVTVLPLNLALDLEYPAG